MGYSVGTRDVGTPPGPLVGRLVSDAVGYSVGSVGTPPGPLVGRLISDALGYSVGSRAVGTPPGPLVGMLASVAVGAPLGARLMDDGIEGYEDDTLGLVEGRELAVGARERIDPLRRILGPACATLSSALLVTNRPKPPEAAAAMPIAAATVLPPTITTVVFQRRRGVGARIILVSFTKLWSSSCEHFGSG